MEKVYNVKLTVEEVIAIKRVHNLLALGQDEGREYIHLQVNNLPQFESIVQSLDKTVPRVDEQRLRREYMHKVLEDMRDKRQKEGRNG